MAKRKFKRKKGPRDKSRSKWCEVRESPIHQRGVFARRDIPAETRIIQYIGEKIDKEESDRRGLAQLERAKETGEAGVYIFTLDDEWDIDGDRQDNIARLINHHCNPNCEAYIDEDSNEIWIWSIRDIKANEELGFNYGFDLDNYEDHPCRCGSEKCVGYIAGEDYWEDLKAKLADEA